MATYTNTGITNLRTGEDAGQLTLNNQVFDFAKDGPATFTSVTTDKIHFATIPAGEVLVQHLSSISLPAIDTHGTPTGDYSIGTADDEDALKGTAASETAVVLTGEDILVSGVIGSPNAPVLLYIHALAAHATVSTTGKIVSNLVTRPYDATIDG